MKLSIFRTTLLILGSMILASFFSSCGHTMYGMGLDMERAGRRLQTNHDPNAAYGAQPQPQQPAPGYGYGY